MLYFLWALSFCHLLPAILVEDSGYYLNDVYNDRPFRQNDKFSSAEYPYVRKSGNTFLPVEGGTNHYDHHGRNARRCSARLEMALEHIRQKQARQSPYEKRSTAPGGGGGNGGHALHIMNGYSLHHQLRSAPYDMYVTDMRVRLPPSSSWVRVDKCRFNPHNSSLETSLLFSDLTISGRVSLFDDLKKQSQQRWPPLPTTTPNSNGGGYEPRSKRDTCSMILRLRRAGIGFHTEPIRRERGQFNVKTDSHFLEPGFISVYAYGCDPGRRLKEHRRSFRTARNLEDNSMDDEELSSDSDGLSREIEDIFLRGIRSLLTTYMQNELQPAIKETLMKNMGYTISYG